LIETLYRIIEEVRSQFAADPRTTVFEIDVEDEEAGWVVFGATSAPAAAEALSARVAQLEPGGGVRDAVVRLPRLDGTLPHALVTAAVAPMLAGPIISESHLSQVLLGQRVVVLREHGRWLQCRSSDGYIGWIHRGYLHRVGEVEARGWEVGAEAPLHFSLGAEVVGEDDEIRVRLPWGARVTAREGVATLPDGSGGRLRGEVLPLADLASRFPPNGTAILETARGWCGSPYLWGGTTPWGVDCSGLVQAVYRTHGVELPRDSDQQAAVGAELEPREDFSTLRAGDLLFFAEQRNRISHVAISAGGSRILHSALGNGGVRFNDLLGDSPYERELLTLLVRTTRVLSPES
jgi:gamma-D-glutamyl-L-lysine dipeptidyl-peptidase